MPARVSGRGGHLRANGIRIHYIDYAGGGEDSPPILVVPGITSPAVSWGFVAERLAPRHRVIVADLRGRGLSESGDHLSYGLDDYVADISDVILGLGLRKPILVGHALGGRIGIRLAAAWPNVLTKLVLVDPPLAGPGRRPYVGHLDHYLHLIESASRGATLEEFRKIYPKWPEAEVALRLQWLPTCSIKAVTDSLAYFQSEDIFADIPQILCETLLMRAALAKVVLPEDAAEIEALNPRVRTVGIEAGHMVPWDNLDGFLAALTAFLGGEVAAASLARA